MRLFLIRHGETVHNVNGVLAGITDSALTSHGSLQAGRLASHLAARFPSTPVRKIFSSDLQRARLTAVAVQSVCGGSIGGRRDSVRPAVVTTPLLRERNFGPLEGMFARSVRVDVDAVAETHESMCIRARRFLNQMLLPELTRYGARADDVYVVVAHGLLLLPLFTCLMERVPYGRLTIDPVVTPDPARGYMPALRPHWDNTAYLECMLVPSSSIANALRLHLLRVNCTDHIRDLKRTRGGIGSAAYDPRQRQINSYFGRKDFNI